MWIDFNQLPDDARIWMFSIVGDISEDTLIQMKKELKVFISEWTSHSATLEASAEWWQDNYLIISLDESKYGASGCSIDKLLRFIQKLEADYKISLLVKSKIGILQGETMKYEDLPAIKHMISNGMLNKNAMYGDTTIASKRELRYHFLKPLHEGWLAKKIFN